jgi:hypothetical protein
MGEAGQPQGEERNQALATGERLGVVPVLSQKRNRVGDGLRCVVREGRWFHAFLPW